MGRMRSVWIRLGGLFHRDRREREMAEELQSHLEMNIEENLRSGMTPQEARRQALIKLGGLEQVKEECRDSWSVRFLEELIQDLRYGLRQLRRSPGFTVVAVLTLALGIGANTAIFTLIETVMLRSLPVSKPGELYRIGNTHQCCDIGGVQPHWSIFSYPLYEQLRDHTHEFSEMAAFSGGLEDFSVRRSGSAAAASTLVGELVSGNYFTMLGIRAFAGRLIQPADDTASAGPTAVISYRAWEKYFGGEPSVVGTTLIVNTVPYTVVGIAPPGFYGDRLITDPPDLWLPLATEPTLEGENSLLSQSGSNWLYVIGRLKPGAKAASVQSEVTVELRNWLRGQPGLSSYERAKAAKTQVVLTPASGGVDVLQHENASGLRLLAVISGLLLLIACANIASLLLARGAARRAETALRVALGASRPRLVRQVFTESALVALLGGLAGLLVAFWGAHIILLLAFRGADYVPISASPSLVVLGFAFLLSILTAVVFGTAPAWAGSQCAPVEALHGAGPPAWDRSSLARRSLVVLQLALSVALLVAAGLLMRSLRNLENQRLGFEPEGRLIVKINPAMAGYKPNELYGLYQRLGAQLLRIPGVLSASWSLYGPMEDTNWEGNIYIEGQPPDERIYSSFDLVGPHFFRTMGTPVLVGRAISEEDAAASRPVAVVNEAFVKDYLKGRDPIGLHFGLGDPKHAGDFEIVGVVGDAKYYHRRDYPMFFLPIPRQAPSFMSRALYIGDIELRVAGRLGGVEPDVYRALAAINPNLTALKTLSLPEQIAEDFNSQRLIARLTELYGALALLLACVGLYGVTSYFVLRRTHEIGIRMALGAEKRDVLRMVIGQGLKLALIGVAIGIAGALALTRFLSSMLYGVKPTDPPTFIAVSLILIAVALAACYMPARRAAKVDPMVALRYE